MSERYRIFGSEMSPYSVKIRSWFRYKGIPHEWLLRTPDTRPEYEKHARLPLIPLVITPDGQGLQDSTPIIERLEALFPEPPIHPDEPVSRFVSELLEEFGDEWGNKWMFHCRWARPVDQESAAGRIARSMAPAASETELAAVREQVRTRMVGRVSFVGSNAVTAPFIEASLAEALEQLNTHLQSRPYLFGGRPAFADFGLAPQLYEAWTDPTVGALIEGRAPRLLDWIHRMLWPRPDGGFEPWETLEGTLMPLLAMQVGARFLPWMAANAAAIERGGAEFRVTLLGDEWVQAPQKYQARSLAALREKYRRADAQHLDPVLERAGCLAVLQG
jgi:glutathione S-transferase